MNDHLERAAIALLKRVEKEAEGATSLSGLADLPSVAVKIAEAAQGKKETAGGTAVHESCSFCPNEAVTVESGAHSPICQECLDATVSDYQKFLES